MLATAILIFNLEVAPLYRAIAQVESDNGATSPNVYQITNAYIDDLNRIYSRHTPYKAKFDKFASEHLMYEYWQYYGTRYQLETGKPVTYAVLIDMHHLGGRYWKTGRAATKEQLRYRNKVLKYINPE